MYESFSENLKIFVKNKKFLKKIDLLKFIQKSLIMSFEKSSTEIVDAIGVIKR